MCSSGPVATWYHRQDYPWDRACKVLHAILRCGGSRINQTLAKITVAIAALNILNLFYSCNIFYTRQVVLVNVSCLALFWITAEIVTVKRLPVLLWVMVGSALIISGIAWYQWGNSKPVISTLGNTNYLGAFLILGIFAGLSLLKPAFLIPYLGVIMGALVLSRARASWIAVTVGLIVWGYLSMTRRVFALSMAVGLLAGVVGWLTVVPQDWMALNTIGYRLKYWQAAGELIKDSPLIGIGFDGYRVKVYDAQARINQRNPGWFNGYQDPKPRRVHNDYLQALVDGGLLYAMTYFGFVFWILARSFQAAKSNPVIRGIWCAQVSTLVVALFFFPLRLIDTTMLFHVNLGVLCSPACASST